MVWWLCSYLDSRTVQLRFDSKESEGIILEAGVPQGSPLSPILFLLYIATLYKALAKSPGLLVMGFVDNTNLMVFSSNVSGQLQETRECLADM